ncbi:MAG: three-helix bundle dimerization domain-containing protein [Actinomycetota bacterium]
MPDDEMLHEREFLHHAAERLRGHFAGTFGPETIERILSDSLARLSGGARIATFVPLLAERFAKERLMAAIQTERPDMTTRPTVLFLCVHNAGRSQMAAGWLQHLAGDQVTVLSGGSAPAESVNPAAVEAMGEVGIDITDSFPKPWTDETLQAADVVVTMGCGDACPVIPGKRYLDWQLDDPAGKDVEGVRPIRDELEVRVRRLLTDMGVEPIRSSDP